MPQRRTQHKGSCSVGAPPPHLKSPSTSYKSKGIQDGKDKTGLGNHFPSLVHPTLPEVTCHYLAADIIVEQGWTRLRKDLLEIGEGILSRGSGLTHTPPKSFPHGKLVRYPFNLLHSFKLWLPTGRVGLMALKITSHKNKLRKSFEIVCIHIKERLKKWHTLGKQWVPHPVCCHPLVSLCPVTYFFNFIFEVNVWAFYILFSSLVSDYHLLFSNEHISLGTI